MKKTIICALIISAVAVAVISVLGVDLSPPFIPIIIPLGRGKPILQKFKQAIKPDKGLKNSIKWRF